MDVNEDLVEHQFLQNLPKKKGGWPKGKKRKPHKKTFTPKAPVTAYVLYANERRLVLKEENAHLSFQEITRLIGHEWSAMTLAQKARFLKAAEDDRTRYRDELSRYHQSRVHVKKLSSDAGHESTSGLETLNPSCLEDLHVEGLFCSTCSVYFTSEHHRTEHMYGRQHLNNLTNSSKNSPTDEFRDQLEEDASESSHVNIGSFIKEFFERNAEREYEIKCLKKRLQEVKSKNENMFEKFQQLKNIQLSLIEELNAYETIGATLASQIESLRMIPMLFGVISF